MGVKESLKLAESALVGGFVVVDDARDVGNSCDARFLTLLGP